MPGEDVRQRLDCGIVGVAARRFRNLVTQINPYLVLPLRAHGWFSSEPSQRFCPSTRRYRDLERERIDAFVARLGHDEGVAEEDAEHAVRRDRVGLGHDDHAGLEHLVDLVGLGALGKDVRLSVTMSMPCTWVGRDCTPCSRKKRLASRMLSVALPGLISATIFW